MLSCNCSARRSAGQSGYARGDPVRRVGFILITILLLLSLFGNFWLWQRYTGLEVQRQVDVAQLQEELAQQAAELEELRTDREYLRQRVRDLEADKARLKEALQGYEGQQDFLERLDRLEAEARALRRLVPPEVVDRQLISREELQAYLEALFTEEYPPEEAATDAQILVVLELLEPGVDLHSLLLDLYTEQVLGFYDLEARRMYVVSDVDLGPLEQLTFVHEYVHALQDQLFDLGEQTEAVSDDGDRLLALEALAEGDATLAMQQYLLEHVDELAGPDLFSQILLADTPQFDAAPGVVQEQLLFPYERGLVFVLAHYEQRGWASVDELWGDPPQSSEQILHPERYPEDTPELVTLPALTATLGADWRFGREDTLGEFLLRLHLAVHLDEEVVDEAATGWGGDRYVLFMRSSTGPHRGEVCLAMGLVWDDEEEADEFVQAYRDYAGERYVEEGEGDLEEGIWWYGRPGLLLRQDDEEVLVIYAPREEVARSVARRIR